MKMAPGPNAVFEVTSVMEAMIAAQGGAGAVVVSVMEDRPIRRMADPSVIREIKENVTNIPIMVKVRVGHVLEARIAAAMGVDYIDENELLPRVDPEKFIDKREFSHVRFVSGCHDFFSLLAKAHEGATVIRIQGDVYSRGDIAETVRNVGRVMHFRRMLELDEDEVLEYAQMVRVSPAVLQLMQRKGGLPAEAYASGGIFTPADAALMMQMGCAGVFLGPDIFRFPNADRRVHAIVNAVKHPREYPLLAFLSMGLEPRASPLLIHSESGSESMDADES